ncbi:hypothetical protein F4778DRAFT_374470 [Xylariomycetidae sp. FL2044]|nr:hypothetical protein F4778DRAFT_374470 [Xylariomycetidae sp. FL2044]
MKTHAHTHSLSLSHSLSISHSNSHSRTHMHSLFLSSCLPLLSPPSLSSLTHFHSSPPSLPLLSRFSHPLFTTIPSQNPPTHHHPQNPQRNTIHRTNQYLPPFPLSSSPSKEKETRRDETRRYQYRQHNNHHHGRHYPTHPPQQEFNTTHHTRHTTPRYVDDSSRRHNTLSDI